jgi:hypothetical protein
MHMGTKTISRIRRHTDAEKASLAYRDTCLLSGHGQRLTASQEDAHVAARRKGLIYYRGRFQPLAEVAERLARSPEWRGSKVSRLGHVICVTHPSGATMLLNTEMP